jgi:hypothetical protein
MIQLFRSLLGGSSHKQHAAKRPAPRTHSKPGLTGGDYRAVSLAPNIECYAAAKDVAGKRYLMREAPHLPLAGCATPEKCTCKFRKHADRRDGDRRLLGDVENTRWFSGSERRARRTRRATKN